MAINRTLSILIPWTGLLLTAAAMAQSSTDIQMFSGALVTMSDAISAAEKSSGGRAIAATFTTEKDAPIFRITVPANSATELYKVEAAAQPATVTKDTGLKSKIKLQTKAELQDAVAAKVTLNEAVAKAQRKVGGKAIEAELENHFDQTGYDIELVDLTGNMKTVIVDLKSGDVFQTSSKQERFQTPLRRY